MRLYRGPPLSTGGPLLKKNIMQKQPYPIYDYLPVVSNGLEIDQKNKECLWRRFRDGKATDVAFLIPATGPKPDDLPGSIWQKAQLQYAHWRKKNL